MPKRTLVEPKAMPPTAGAERLLAELRDAAEVLTPSIAPAQLAADLVAGAPDLAMSDLEDVIARVRDGGLRAVFHDETDLRNFYRVYGQRLLARQMVLAEKVLVLVGQKLDTTPLAQHSMLTLMKVVDVLTRSTQGMAEIALKAAEQKAREEARRAGQTTEVLAAEAAQKRQELLELRGGAPVHVESGV